MALATNSSSSQARFRSVLHCRLEERRAEIEQAALTRVYAIADPIEAADPQYADGLRAAVSAALDYGLAAIECGKAQAPPVPISLLAQARLAARSNVNLDTVLRRYFAGYTLFGDFLVQEAEGESDLSGAELQGLLRTQAVLFDRLVEAVSEEYGRERSVRTQTREHRRAECVDRLLAGDLLDATELDYEFDCWHVAALIRGANEEGPVRELACSFDCRLLVVSRDEDTAWAWFGSRRRVDPAELLRFASSFDAQPKALALGEPAAGLAGWRLSHRQAAVALPIALRGSQPFVRYADVALLASASRDPDLATSLRQIYVVPLAEERDGGGRLRETLLAYFAAGRQVSATAAVLGISRQTVSSRLRAAEDRIGRSLDACAADIEIALGLERLSSCQVFGPD